MSWSGPSWGYLVAVLVISFFMLSIEPLGAGGPMCAQLTEASSLRPRRLYRVRLTLESDELPSMALECTISLSGRPCVIHQKVSSLGRLKLN